MSETEPRAASAAPATPEREAVDAHSRIKLGSPAFIAVLSLSMATTALAIDSVLAAFDEIREALNLAPNATEVTGLITAYFVGNSLGLLPAGLLSDRFGRRPVIWGGLALYIVSAIAAILAPSLTLMLIARFFWGLGAAGPRVAALAMVRDGFSGAQMARQMSLIMAVFLLVPAFAPTIAVGVLAIGPWWGVYAMCAIAAAFVALLVTGLPETLPAQHEPTRVETVAASRPSVWSSVMAVMRTPGTIAYMASLTALFSVFLSYLASSEIIIDQVFDLEAWFPIIFGGLALAMLAGMLVNGRIVERTGLSRLISLVFFANLATCCLFLVVALATDGRPPFWLFAVVIASVLFTQQMLLPNVNTAAMVPLAAVAGTGAALLGMIPGTIGSILGSVIDRQFDGSVTPLAVAFVICSIAAQLFWRQAERAEKGAASAALAASSTSHG